ncbi:MAG: hypothetical protein ABFR75_05345 [Acidobacteriota bacterium]
MQFKEKKYFFLIIIFFIVLIIHHPILKAISGSKLAIPYAPDTQYILSVIEWNQYAISNELPAIYHLNYFYPNAFVTFYGHPLFGESLIFFFLNSLLGLSLVNTYNLYLLLGFFIGGVGVYLLARELLKNSYGAYLASLIYITYPLFKDIAIFLNIFSLFWIGYIFYYLIKYQRNKKIKDALLCGSFIFLQGFFSIYHGFFILGVFLPVFFLVSLLFSTSDWRSIFRFFVYITPFLLILLLIYHPFITVIGKTDVKRELHYESLIDVNKLFNSGSTLYQKAGLSNPKVIKIFPGFLSLALLGLTLTGIRKKKVYFIAITMVQLLLVFILKGSVFISNLLFIIIFIQVFLFVFYYRNSYEERIKVLLFSFLIYFILFFKFSTIFSGIEFSFYGLIIKAIPSFGNFRYLYRGIFILFPIFAVLASLGAQKIMEKVKNKKRIFFLILAVILIFENIKTTPFRSEVRFETEKYNKIEKKSNKIILEIPIYKPGYMQIKDSLYTVNTFLHYNYYVNGRVAYRTFDDSIEIFDKVFKNKSFPDRENVKYLMEEYSVNYIIFNLEKRLPYNREDIIKRSLELKDLCRIIKNNSKTIILKMQENYPLKVIKRRFSYFHLKYRKIYIKLSSPYTGPITLAFPSKKKTKTINVKNSSEITIDFPKINPDMKGNKVRISFEKNVRIKQIDLIKK